MALPTIMTFDSMGDHDVSYLVQQSTNYVVENRQECNMMCMQDLQLRSTTKNNNVYLFNIFYVLSNRVVFDSTLSSSFR